MSRRANLWAKSLMVTTMLTVYTMPGCNFSLDDPMLQALLDSSLANGDFKFEFEFEADASDDGFHDESDDDFHDE